MAPDRLSPTWQRQPHVLINSMDSNSTKSHAEPINCDVERGRRARSAAKVLLKDKLCHQRWTGEWPIIGIGIVLYEFAYWFLPMTKFLKVWYLGRWYIICENSIMLGIFTFCQRLTCWLSSRPVMLIWRYRYFHLTNVTRTTTIANEYASANAVDFERKLWVKNNFKSLGYILPLRIYIDSRSAKQFNQVFEIVVGFSQKPAWPCWQYSRRLRNKQNTQRRRDFTVVCDWWQPNKLTTLSK